LTRSQKTNLRKKRKLIALKEALAAKEAPSSQPPALSPAQTELSARPAPVVEEETPKDVAQLPAVAGPQGDEKVDAEEMFKAAWEAAYDREIDPKQREAAGPIAPVPREQENFIYSRAPLISYGLGGASICAVLGLTLKATVLTAAAHFAAPVVASCAVWEGTKYLLTHFTGDRVVEPDMELFIKETCQHHAIDPELFAVALQAVANRPRTRDNLLSLQRTCTAWARSKRVNWSESVKATQVFKATRFAFGSSITEDANASFFGARGIFRNITRATKMSDGAVGRYRLPDS